MKLAKKVGRAVKSWWLSRTSGKLTSTVELRGKFFRVARRVGVLGAKHRRMIDMGLREIAISLFGKNFEKKPEGNLILATITQSYAIGGIKNQLKRYLSADGNMETAREILSKFKEVQTELLNTYDEKRADKFELARHKIAPYLYERVKLLRKAIIEVEAERKA